MQRRQFIASTVGTLALLAGCTSSASDAPGTKQANTGGGGQEWHGLPGCSDAHVFTVVDAEVQLNTASGGATVKGVLENRTVDDHEITINVNFLDSTGEHVGFDRISGDVYAGERLPFEVTYSGKHWAIVDDFELDISPSACH